MLRKLFQKRKEVPQEAPSPNPPDISDSLAGTAKELHDLGVRYAVVSIAATEDNQDVIALRTASLRLERMSRQFSMSAALLKSRRIDEEAE